MEPVGPLQLRCMNFMWVNGPATVHDVVTHLNTVGPRKVVYTTALTVLRNLVKRRFCTTETKGRAFVFTPTLTKAEYQLSMMRNIRDALFDGEVEKMHAFMESPAFSSDRAAAKK